MRESEHCHNSRTERDPLQEEEEEENQEQMRRTHNSTQTSSFLVKSLLHKPRMLVPKRVLRLALVTCLLVAMALVYVTLFRHPPPDQLLKMNGGGKDFNLRAVFGHVDDWDARNGPLDSHARSRDTRHANKAAINQHKGKDIFNILDELDDENADGGSDDAGDDVDSRNSKDKSDRSILQGGARHEQRENQKELGAGEDTLLGKAEWDKFIADNKFTTIGIVLDACERPREQLGTVVLLEDKENGGVKSRTFYNFTLDEDLSEGTFSIDVKYNGQDLYDNYWDICEMEEDLDPKNRTFQCPIRKGRQALVKDKHIPSYLPKGHYQSKAWVKDSKERLLVCGFSDFKL